jgi:hypothetical protein
MPWAAGALILAGAVLLLLRGRSDRTSDDHGKDAPAPAAPGDGASNPPTPLASRGVEPRRTSLDRVDEGPRSRAIDRHGLRLLSQPASGETVDVSLGAGTHVVGVAPDVDVRLSSSTVSGHHLQLHIDETRTTVMDLGSSNGTFINNVRLPPRQPTELRTGDILALSRSVVLRVESGAGKESGRETHHRTRLEE